MISLSAPGSSTSHYALVTLADLKSFMLESGTANDTLLQAILDGVHRGVYVETGGRFLKDPGVDFDFLLDGRGGDQLFLPHWPIVSISRLEWIRMLGAGSFETLHAYTAADYQLDSEGGAIWCVIGWWPDGQNLIRATWRAGYAATPADVKEAVCQWAATRARRAFEARHDKLSVVHEADNVSYTRDDIPEAAAKVLKRYARLEASIA